MFKKIALGGLLLSMFSLPLLAQQTAAPADATTQTQAPGHKNKGMRAYQAGDPATRAKKMADRMTQQLGLDQATSQKIYDATLARAQKIDAIQTGTDDNQTKAKALKANADDFKSKLQSILSPDQFAKFQQMKGHGHHGDGKKGSNTENTDNDGTK